MTVPCQSYTLSILFPYLSCLLFQALCNHCKSLISRNDGSTTVMIKHLFDLHEEQYQKYLKDLEAQNKAKAKKLKETRELEEQVEQSQETLDELQGTSSQVRKRPIVTPITKYFSKSSPAKYKPDSDLQRRAELDMAIYIATSNLSFNHIETPSFKRFLLSLNPKVNVRSRSALVKTIIPLLKRNLREAMDKFLAEHLPKVPGAGFTMDIWSSKGQHSYLSLTMHIIDGKWRLQNLLMACRSFEEPDHTAALIGEKTEDMLEQIPLPVDANLVFTTDGAKNMIKAMRESPMVNEHLVCFCHILSNCVKDAFAVPRINDAITKLQELAGATHKSIKRITAIRRA